MEINLREKKIKSFSSVTALAGVVIVSNAFLYGMYLYKPGMSSSAIFQRLASFISMTAVFPYDFFNSYFSFLRVAQASWVMIVIVCSLGVLLLNKFARSIFILLNIIHVVLLGYLVVTFFNTPDFFEYFFKFYFNAVVSGTYMALLTLPEIREKFKVEKQGLRLEILLKKPLGKKIRALDSPKYAGLSIAYERLERYDEAIEALRKAILGDPENKELFFRQGLMFLKQREEERAIQSFKKAIELDPLYYEAYYNLGVLYVKQGCSREATAMFFRATCVRPTDVQAYRDLADATFSLGDFKEALTYFEKAVSLNKGDAYSYYRMGCILGEYMNDNQKAFESLRAAVSIEKKFFDAQFHLGKVSLQLKRYKDAVRAFKQALALQEDNVQSHYHLGFAYAMLKDFNSARKQCQYLSLHDPDLAKNLSILLSY